MSERWFLVDFRAAAAGVRPFEFRFQAENFDVPAAACAFVRYQDIDVVINCEFLGAVMYVPSYPLRTFDDRTGRGSPPAKRVSRIAAD